MSNIIKINTLSPESVLLAQAAACLAAGGIVAYPTETFYGLAADYQNPRALARLEELKGGREDKPFALIISRLEEAYDLAAEVSPLARQLMETHWPGALTLVLPAAAGLDQRLCSASGGVGMRLSPHGVAKGLAQALGRALTATSANLSGQSPAVYASEIDEKVIAGLDLVLDAGPCAGGRASTVLDLLGKKPVLLRPGAVII